MTTAAIAVQDLSDESVLALVSNGDCSRLSPAQKLAYYKARCEAAGLDYRTAPFQFLRLQGKEILYALKAATDQLSSKHGIRCEIVAQQTENEIRVVTVRAACADGRQTDEIGAVPVGKLSGEALCNALMKCVTKAKRRAILSVCGLGMLDETELDTIPDAKPAVSDLPMPRRKSEKEGSLEPALRASLAAKAGSAASETSPESTRAGEAPSPPGDAVMGSASDAALPFPPRDDSDPSDEPVLVNAHDLRELYGIATGAGHKRDAIRRWLFEAYQIHSGAEIERAWLPAIRDRLSDPEPLL